MDDMVYIGQGAYLNTVTRDIYLADSDGYLAYLCSEEAFVALAEMADL